MLLTISVAVIAGFTVIASIILAIVSLRVLRAVREAEEFLGTARSHITPLSHDLAIILKDLTEIVNSAKYQVYDLEKSVANVKEGSRQLREFEQHTLQKLEEPVSQLLATTWAISQVVLLANRVLGRRNRRIR